MLGLRAQSVSAEAHTFTHTCLKVVSSWVCLWERRVAGRFWFCLAPRESSQVFLLQGTPLPISEGKPLCHPCCPMALPKQRAVKGPAFSSAQPGSTETLAITDVQFVALFSVPRASCESLGSGVCAATALRGLPELSLLHLPGSVRRVSEKRAALLALQKLFHFKERCQRRQ